jgi:hypothetical protein
MLRILRYKTLQFVLRFHPSSIHLRCSTRGERRDFMKGPAAQFIHQYAITLIANKPEIDIHS